MSFNSPLSDTKVDQLIALLKLSPSSHVLDLGCGTGELLVRLAERTDARGVGLDLNPESIKEARRRAQERAPDGDLTFTCADASAEAEDAEPIYDCVSCVGSTHAFGMGRAAYPGAIEAMTRWARPGGLILIGEGYWKQPPAQAYLDFLGEPTGIYHTHKENIDFAEDRGLIPAYATTSNQDEWDHFEWSHRLRVEREALDRPTDPDVLARQERSRAWRDAYLRWGRDTMGFGVYLFIKPR